MTVVSFALNGSARTLVFARAASALVPASGGATVNPKAVKQAERKNALRLKFMTGVGLGAGIVN